MVHLHLNYVCVFGDYLFFQLILVLTLALEYRITKVISMSRTKVVLEIVTV